MRAIRPDTEVFSMSALDLFASALGAFMLTSIMSLPFFPNTGDSVEQVTAAQQALADARAAEARAQAAREAAKAARAEAREDTSGILLPALDLVIVLDVTTSMGEQIANLQSELQTLIVTLDKLAPSVAIGMVTFTDREMRPRTQRLPLTVLTDRPRNLARVREFLAGLERIASPRNRDHEEAVLAGLRAVETIGFRDEADLKMAVVITDALPYADEVSPSLSVARALASRGIRTSGINVLSEGTDARQRQASMDFLGRLANVGQGVLVRSGSSVTVTLLEVIL